MLVDVDGIGSLSSASSSSIGISFTGRSTVDKTVPTAAMDLFRLMAASPVVSSTLGNSNGSDGVSGFLDRIFGPGSVVLAHKSGSGKEIPCISRRTSSTRILFLNQSDSLVFILSKEYKAYVVHYLIVLRDEILNFVVPLVYKSVTQNITQKTIYVMFISFFGNSYIDLSFYIIPTKGVGHRLAFM
jgi:hypothetical protein